MAAYTVTVQDLSNLVSPQVEEQMRSASNFVMQNLSEFVNWRGTLDLMINVLPPLSPHDGITPAILQNMPNPNGPGWRNATLHEMLTGVDPYPDHPDVGMTVHLGNDGSVKLYGMKAYFDPNPGTYVPAVVPFGHFDFIGVLNHEVAHGVAFQFGTVDFSSHIQQFGGYSYFTGSHTVETLGQPLPMSTFGGTHYGNYLVSNNPVNSGLMWQFGNYSGNRLDWGKVDLAVLRDLGLTTKNESNLPLFDVRDRDIARIFVSTSGVSENMPINTVAATIGTTEGTSDFTFSLADGWDSEYFRIVGTTIVTTTPLDYETTKSLVVYAQMRDSDGVVTRGRVEINVFDVVDEQPVFRAPSSFQMVNGQGSLSGMSFSGDPNAIALFVVFSRNGKLEITDSRDVFSQVVKNKAGGTTLFMRGTLTNLSQNFNKIRYFGNERSLSIQVAHNNKNIADISVPIIHMFPRNVVIGPVRQSPVPRRVLTRQMRQAAFARLAIQMQNQEIQRQTARRRATNLFV